MPRAYPGTGTGYGTGFVDSISFASIHVSFQKISASKWKTGLNWCNLYATGHTQKDALSMCVRCFSSGHVVLWCHRFHKVVFSRNTVSTPVSCGQKAKMILNFCGLTSFHCDVYVICHHSTMATKGQ